MWLDILASRSWDRNPIDSNSIQASNHQPRGASSSEVNFKRLWITITIVYIHPFNGYRDLNSYMKRLTINANGNTITSFARELNPTVIYIYIYIYYVLVFNWNHFEMRLLNLRINFFFYLLRTFCPHQGSFLCCFFFLFLKEETTQKATKMRTKSQQ